MDMRRPGSTPTGFENNDQRKQSDVPSEPKAVLRNAPGSYTIAGATVAFADGAAVSKVALPADFSMVAISNLSINTIPRNVQTALRDWVPDGDIEILAWKMDPQTLLRAAEVKVADGGRLCRDDFSKKSKLKLLETDLRIRPIHLAASEASTNRLQLANVTCAWHSPSRTAHLEFRNNDRMNRAYSALQDTTRLLDGRQLTYSLGSRARGTIHIVHVFNLDSETSVEDLRQHLNRHAPATIELGPSTHSMPKHDLQYQVKASLEKHGNLQEWVVSPQPGIANVKAYAKFASHDEAARVVKALDGSRIDAKSRDVLHMQHVVSVKLPVSQRILTAIQPDLRALVQTSQSNDHVMV